jgi:hypothetical protein
MAKSSGRSRPAAHLDIRASASRAVLTGLRSGERSSSRIRAALAKRAERLQACAGSGPPEQAIGGSTPARGGLMRGGRRLRSASPQAKSGPPLKPVLRQIIEAGGAGRQERARRATRLSCRSRNTRTGTAVPRPHPGRQHRADAPVINNYHRDKFSIYAVDPPAITRPRGPVQTIRIPST